MTTEGFEATLHPDDRAIVVSGLGGEPWCTLHLGAPGDSVEGWEPDADELVLARSVDVETRVRVFRDVRQWTLFVTVDNRRDEPVALPELGLGVTLAPGTVGWSWSTDLDGFIAVAPDEGAGPVFVLRLRQGFLRPSRDRPVFGTRTGEAAAFHLCPPAGHLGAHRRHQVTLAAETVVSLAAVEPMLPPWLPLVVGDGGDEVEFHTPDEGVSAGVGVGVTVVDTAAVATVRSAGHGIVSLHGIRGVQRVRLTAAPGLADLVPPLVEAVKSRRPSARASASGLLVAEALVRGLVTDDDVVVDWLEREDWPARGDLEGVAAAAALAVYTRDDGLLSDAWGVLEGLPTRSGSGLVTMKLWLASLTVTGTAPTLAQDLLARPGTDDLSRLELALLSPHGADGLGPRLAGVVNALGDGLPGQPLGLSVRDAADRINLLRLCPERWQESARAATCAQKARRLVLADYAEGLHDDLGGLAWLLLGELGA